MLGLLALLGYMGHAAHLRLSSNNDVVPALFQALFPNWFAGFAFAAIAIGALVPAAVMSIGAANLFTRNFWKAYVNPQIDEAGEAAVAKITSLVVKVGALLVILYLPTQFALDLQLLGGLWILQTLPALIFGLFTRWFTAPALFAGWAVGLIGGTWLAWADGLKPLHGLTLGETTVTAYVGLIALDAKVLVAVFVNLLVPARRMVTGPDASYQR
jgi:SSS family solute:Na+ symporter